MGKKIIVLFSILFLLFSCGQEEKSDGLDNYEGEHFTMRIPKRWEKLKNKQNILPTPKVGQIELAITSKAKIDDFANSFVILSEDVKEGTDSLSYSVSNHIGSDNYYYNYNLIKEVDSKLGETSDSDTSKLYVFDAQYNNSTPKERFLQMGVVCGTKGYILSLAIPRTVNDVLRYEYMFSTFRCK